MTKIKLFPLVVILLFSKEAWVSGAYSISGISKYYTLTMSENTYPIYSAGQGPSSDEIANERKQWIERLTQSMSHMDTWLETESHSIKIQPFEISLFSDSYYRNKNENLKHEGFELKNPGLLPLRKCTVGNNSSIEVSLNLKDIPNSEKLAELEKSLCEYLNKKQGVAPKDRIIVEEVSKLESSRIGDKLTFESPGYIRADRALSLNSERKTVLAEAEDVIGKIFSNAEREFKKSDLKFGNFKSTPKVLGSIDPLMVHFSVSTPFGGLRLKAPYSMKNPPIDFSRTLSDKIYLKITDSEKFPRPAKSFSELVTEKSKK